MDLFANLPYGSVDFEKIEAALTTEFSFVYNKDKNIPALNALPNNFGLILQLGNSYSGSVKVDIINWSGLFVDAPLLVHGIRIASIEDIALMKLEAILNGGRKKDFWDLSELLENFSLKELLDKYLKAYPYYSQDEVKESVLNFSKAESQPDPVCFKNKSWESVKADLQKKVNQLKQTRRHRKDQDSKSFFKKLSK